MINTICATTPRTLTASLVIDDQALESLRDEWESLLEESDQCVYFLRWSWIRLWWKTYRPARSHLYIITCRDEIGRLIGLAPLYLRERRTAGIPHVRELAFLGTGVFVQTSEYLDLIARRGLEEEVARSVAGCLAGRSDWDRLWLNEIPAQSTVLPHLGRAIGDAAQVVPCNRSRYIDTTVDWKTFTASLRKSTRYGVISKTARLFELHECRFERVETQEQLTPALDAMIQLHQARLQSKGEPGSFVLEGFESLIREAARIGLAEGRIRAWTLRIDGRIAAARLAFMDNGVVHAFQGGFDPAFAKHSLGTVMVGLCVRDCIEDNRVREYDFMGGADRYKDWWTSLGRDTVRLTVNRRGLRTTIANSLERADGLARSVVRRMIPATLRGAVHKRVIQLRHHSR